MEYKLIIDAEICLYILMGIAKSIIVGKVGKYKRSPCSSMVEQRPPKPKVVGSIPIMDAFYHMLAYLLLIEKKIILIHIF